VLLFIFRVTNPKVAAMEKDHTVTLNVVETWKTVAASEVHNIGEWRDVPANERLFYRGWTILNQRHQRRG